MNASEISELIKAANQRVHAKKNRFLTIQQEVILRQALEGKRLKDIIVEGYSDLTVQQLYCPELWKLLSEITEQKVSIRTVPLVLRNLLKEPQTHSASVSRLDQVEFSPPASPSAPLVRHNLPAPTCNAFIGREQEIAKLLELLSPRHGAHLISVDGIGGVGKTTLVVEAAYCCLQASNNLDEAFQGFPTFEVIIFTSAKQHYLAPFSCIRRVSRPQRTLQDIFWQIARTLGNVDIVGKQVEDQIELLQEALASVRTLLIVDNLETVENAEDILSFLYCDLPPTVKAIVTTRKQGYFTPLRLSALPEPDALKLIQYEAEEKAVLLSQDANFELYQKTGGLPVAIHYAIGQMISGYSVESVLAQLAQADGDVARFCFKTSVALLQNQPAHRLLMALTFFTAPVQQETWVEVALSETNFDEAKYPKQQIVEKAIADLRKLSLVLQQQERYSLLSLTYEYATAELGKHPDFEREARERWIGWCLELAEKWGQQSRWDWQIQNDVLEAEWANIQAVIEWCMHQERYEPLCQFWKHFDAHVYLQGDRFNRSECWGENLEWIDWLIQTAKQRDPAFAAEVMASRGWLFTAIGQPENLQTADNLYREAWSLSDSKSTAFRLSLAVNIMALRVHQAEQGVQDFTEAQIWLQRAVNLLKEPLADAERCLQLSRIRYYQGRMSFIARDFEQSESYFREALEYAQAIQWQRVVHRVRNWLADIAIQQENFVEAEQLLLEEVQITEQNQDTYQLAFDQQSLATLAKAQNKQEMAEEWALAALKSFETLNMKSEVKATEALLQDLSQDG